MKNRKWFITGISSGLGKALAEELIKNEEFVLGTFRRKEQVIQFNSNHQGRAQAYLLDITNELQIQQTVADIYSNHKHIDILVNNAGVGIIGAVEETSMTEIRSIFESNFFGTLKLTNEVLPIMRKQRSGHIIQISSHGGLKAFAGFGIYNASKFALEGFSEALAQEIAPLGLKLTLVEPGPFRTNFAGTSLQVAANKIDDYNDTAGVFRSKLKGVDGVQEGSPEKAAKAIISLANNETPPLRLPLGKIALHTIGMKLESVSTDLENARSIAENVVY